MCKLSESADKAQLFLNLKMTLINYYGISKYISIFYLAVILDFGIINITNQTVIPRV